MAPSESYRWLRTGFLKACSAAFAFLIFLAAASTAQAQIAVPGGSAAQYYYDYDTGTWDYGYNTGEIIDGVFVGYYAAGGNYNAYGGGSLEFINPAGGSFSGGNWGGISFNLAYVDPNTNQLVDSGTTSYFFQPAPMANDFAVIGPLGTSSTQDGPIDTGGGYYIYPGQFSGATSYTVDMGTNTVAEIYVEAGLPPANLGGSTEASPNLNLSGAFTARISATILGNDDQAVTITGSQGGSFSSPLLDLYGPVNVTGGELSGDYLLIDTEADQGVPSTFSEVDVSGPNTSIVSSGSLLIGQSDNLPAELTIEQGATGTFNNVFVGCGDADSIGSLKINGGQVAISGFLEIGAGGSGTLTVENGGTLTTGTAQSEEDTGTYFTGANADTPATATVDGQGSTWTNTGGFVIGYYADAPSSLTVSNGGDVSTSGELVVGSGTGGTAEVDIESGGTLEAGTAQNADDTGVSVGDAEDSTGTVEVTGAGSALKVTSSLLIGNNGTGTVTVEDSGDLQVQGNVNIGAVQGSTGTLTLNNATAEVSGTLQVGAGGAATLMVENGATLTTGTGQSDSETGAIINGTDEEDAASATVDGSGTKWTNTGNLTIGSTGEGSSTLTISNSADVEVTGELILGDGPGEADVVLESGATLETGTDLSNDSGGSAAAALVRSVATADSAALSPVSNSGTPAAIIGNVAGSSTTFTVTGPNTKWTASSLLINGYQGQGNIIVQNGATLAGDLITIGDNASGSMTVTGSSSGSSSGSASTLTFSQGIIVGESAAGTLTVNQGSQLTYNGPGSADNGILLGDNAGSSGTGILSDSGSSVTTPILDVGNNGSGTFTVQNGATLTAATTVVGFGSGGGTLSINGGGQPGTSASLGTAIVGFNGNGVLTISDGGTATATSLSVAVGPEPPDNNPNGSVSVDGNNSTLTINGNVIDGDGADNDGIISVSNGAFFTANSVVLGTDDGYGRLTLQGGGATATINENLGVYAGSSSTAAVDIGGNSTLTDIGNVTIDVADQPGLNVPTAIVAGSGALWSINGNLTVGQNGYGESFVQLAGHENVEGNLVIGQNAGSTGKIDVNGSGSAFSVIGTTNIGEDDTGFMGFENGAQGAFVGTVTVADGILSLGYVTDSPNAGTLVTTNELDVGVVGNGPNGVAQVSVNGGASLVSSSLVDIEAGGSVSLNAGEGGAQSSLSAASINVGLYGSLYAYTGTLISTSGAITIQAGGYANFQAHSFLNAAGGVYVNGVPVNVGGNTPAAASGAAGAGTLAGGGTINGNVYNAGIVAPGDPQTMTINGNYVQMSGGFLILDVDGNGAGQYDQLVVTGNLSINSGATLELDFADGFAPTKGETFNLVDYGTLDPLNAEFTTVDITGLAAGFEYLLTPLGTDGTDFQLTALNNGAATTTPEPGTWALLLSGLALLAAIRARSGRMC